MSYELILLNIILTVCTLAFVVIVPYIVYLFLKDIGVIK